MNWKKALDGMTPYKPGRSIDEVTSQYGLNEVVKLASNETPYGSAPSVKEFMATAASQHEIYPDGHASVLRSKLALQHLVGEDLILFGKGSDEIVMIISRALLSTGSNMVRGPP